LFEEGDGMRVHQEKGTVHTNVSSTFEWMEEGGPSNTFEGCLSQEYEKKKKCCNVQIRKENMKSIPTNKVRENSTQSQVQFEPELPDTMEPSTGRRKRSYRRITRRESIKPKIRKIGEDRLEKVSLQSVRRWMTESTCVAHCMENINEREIMDVRYDVWVNSKTHDDRVTWILRKMRTFVKQNEGTGWMDFNFYIGGKFVCNACYAHVLGYSRRQLE
jgi:hypothetical protein